MQIELRQIDAIRDLQFLLDTEAAVFAPEDRFDAETWQKYKPFQVLVNGEACGVLGVAADRRPAKHYDEDEIQSPGDLFLATIAIHPDYQGKGVGASAISQLILWAQSEGFHRILSNFRESNVISRIFHHACGFSVVGRFPQYYDSLEDAIVVERFIRR